MDQYMPILLIVGLILLVGVGIIISWKMEKKRREQLAALAAELGWAFEASRDHGHDEEYAHFEVFRRGHGRAAYNTMSGVAMFGGRDYPAKAGDFTYKVTSGHGKNRKTTTYHFSYLIVHLPWRTPDLLIRREGVFDKLAGAFGFDDIDFESEEFSRRFCVKSPDRKFAYDVIDPRMMEFLLGSNPPAIDIEHARCCIVDGTRRWRPEEFRSRIAWLGEFFGRWPAHLTRTLDDTRAVRAQGA